MYSSAFRITWKQILWTAEKRPNLWRLCFLLCAIVAQTHIPVRGFLCSVFSHRTPRLVILACRLRSANDTAITNRASDLIWSNYLFTQNLPGHKIHYQSQKRIRNSGPQLKTQSMLKKHLVGEFTVNSVDYMKLMLCMTAVFHNYVGSSMHST